MGNDVFANGREVSCKAASGKSICAFPDVCFTPPQTPATPPGVPIPYPNTGMGSDTSKGSRDVKITGKEVMLKNKSMFKKSMGDQAGCAPKKGVVTSQIGGKVYFNSWSMDVKIEGENAVRHLDLTTHNHGSVPGNTPTWPYVDQSAVGGFKDNDPCKDDIIREQEACAGYKPYGDADACAIAEYDTQVKKKLKMSVQEAMDLTFAAESDAFEADGDEYYFKGGEKADPKTSTAPVSQGDAQKCLTARVCQLVPYTPVGNEAKCCGSQTPHHIVEASSFFKTGRSGAGKVLAVGAKKVDKATVYKQGKMPLYREGKAPSVCAFGPSQSRGSHELLHTFQGALNKASQSKKKERLPLHRGGTAKVHTISYGTARDNGIKAVGLANPTAECKDNCLKAQLDAYHKDDLGIDENEKIKCVGTGRTKKENVKAAEKRVENRKRKRSASLG